MGRGGIPYPSSNRDCCPAVAVAVADAVAVANSVANSADKTDVVEAFVKHLQGVHYSALVDASKKVVAAQWKHTYRYPRALIKDLKDRGYFLLALSNSPKIIFSSVVLPAPGSPITSSILRPRRSKNACRMISSG